MGRSQGDMRRFDKRVREVFMSVPRSREGRSTRAEPLGADERSAVALSETFAVLTATAAPR